MQCMKIFVTPCHLLRVSCLEEVAKLKNINENNKKKRTKKKKDKEKAKIVAKMEENDTFPIVSDLVDFYSHKK